MTGGWGERRSQEGIPGLTGAAAKRTALIPASTFDSHGASYAVTHLTADLSTRPPSKPIPKRGKKEHKSAAPGSEVDDPQYCVDYASDIYQYLRSRELGTKRMLVANYMGTVQKDVTANMRAILDGLDCPRRRGIQAGIWHHLPHRLVHRLISFRPSHKPAQIAAPQYVLHAHRPEIRRDNSSPCGRFLLHQARGGLNGELSSKLSQVCVGQSYHQNLLEVLYQGW